MLETSYQVERGPDGIRWVSIEPLMTDINNSMVEMVNMDVSSLTEENKEIVDLKILGLRTIYQFLGSLITADDLKKIKNETTDRPTVH